MKPTTAVNVVLGAAIIGALGYALYLVKKNGVVGAGAVVGAAVADAATGAVLGIGDSIGVPRTDMTACQKAIAEGRTWDASFACPAGTFIGSLFSSTPAPVPTPAVPATERFNDRRYSGGADAWDTSTQANLYDPLAGFILSP